VLAADVDVIAGLAERVLEERGAGEPAVRENAFDGDGEDVPVLGFVAPVAGVRRECDAPVIWLVVVDTVVGTAACIVERACVCTCDCTVPRWALAAVPGST